MRIVSKFIFYVFLFSMFNVQHNPMKWGIDVQIMNPDGSIEFIDTDIVSCPKCGSTHIQVVPRKWSIFSGIFTNKVDRVCLKCKYKF